MEISPTPTDEEAAALAAALHTMLRRTVVAPAPPAASSPRWRFAGRWWSKPIPTRRARPW